MFDTAPPTVAPTRQILETPKYFLELWYPFVPFTIHGRRGKRLSVPSASVGEGTKCHGEESPEMSLLSFFQCGMTYGEVALKYKSEICRGESFILASQQSRLRIIVATEIRILGVNLAHEKRALL